MKTRSRVWLDRDRRDILKSGRVLVMGIVNVTDDSFFSGSRTPDMHAAAARADRCIAEGASILDIGGESTRPGAVPVDAETELARIIPLIRAVRAQHPNILISVDTYKASTAEAALAAGADIINDVSALSFDKDMAGVVSSGKAPVILMHMQGTPATMQNDPQYTDAAAEVGDYLMERIRFAESHGIDRDRIVVDPGIGFGKSFAHNIAILHAMPAIKERTTRPVLVGLSRKRFIGDITGRAVGERLAGSLGAAVAAASLGADIIRTHDVAETSEALSVADAILTERTA